MREYDEIAFLEGDEGYYMRPHPHCCGIQCVYMQGEAVAPEELNYAIQYSIWWGSGNTLIEITLTDDQVNPEHNKDWFDPGEQQDKEESLAVLKEWDFRLVSSFVNGNTDSTIYVFHRLPDWSKEDLVELDY